MMKRHDPNKNFPKIRKCTFAKCIRLACLLSFASLFIIFLVLQNVLTSREKGMMFDMYNGNQEQYCFLLTFLLIVGRSVSPNKSFQMQLHPWHLPLSVGQGSIKRNLFLLIHFEGGGPMESNAARKGWRFHLIFFFFIRMVQNICI